MIQRSAHIKYTEPSKKIVQQLLSKELLQNYGRSSILLITAKDIPNLQFKLAETGESSKIHEESTNLLEGAEEVLEVTESDVLTETIITTPKDQLSNSEIHDALRNFLRSAAGTALRPTTTEHDMEITFNINICNLPSKYCEHSEN